MWAVLTTGGRIVAMNVADESEKAVRAQYDMRGKRVVQLARALVDFETVTLAGEIVADDAARLAHHRMLIDRGHLTERGAAAIEAAHARKAMEAVAVLAGGGGRLLEAEAKARGIGIEELARLVIERDDASIAAEVSRVMRKNALS